ncbi:hypothetical protein LKO27_14855 [Tessaracoccus sp. OS52]|uniref:hypothetical protein n=1 Tax=Tessaracoccus sp. OS52 TaxID=2886691 RepID=UPI001D108F63|nr:hypothetical protein [Tessaracoccus sp. OS52]MCC2594680.1 hypothetical protein [Tessaracoccus sp. OS52]
MSNLPIRAEFTQAGALARLDAGELSVLQYPASELEPGPHQVWLRWRDPVPRSLGREAPRAEGHEALGLTGPASGGEIAATADGVVLRGNHRDVEWELWWEQPGEGRFGWGLRVVNRGEESVELDAVWTLDAALTPWDALRRNEFYVSQYLDLTPIPDGDRLQMAVRQNMPGPTNPWLLLGATRPVAGWCTDAVQLRPATPGTGLDLTKDLPSVRRQHEHTLAGLQTTPWTLEPGAEGVVGFRAVVVADHPGASGPADAERFAALLSDGWAERAPSADDARQAVPTLFSPARFAHGEPLEERALARLAGDPTDPERGPDGEVWSYRAGAGHVVTAAKEAAVLRPHGHIIRAAGGLLPQDANAAVTVWMNGNFGSQLTVGHASAAPLLSVRRSYLGLTQAEGIRLFVDAGEGWRLLGLPSAWAVDHTSATWWYRLGGRTVQVVTRLTLTALSLAVHVDGEPVGLLVSATGSADIGGDSSLLFSDERPRGDQWHAVVHSEVTDLTLELPLRGGGAQPGDTSVWQKERSFVAPATVSEHAAAEARPDFVAVPSLTGGDDVARRLDALLPWLAQNAFVHYQAPRGLEQFTGGAWGTRDVCQGPVGLLVALGRLDVVREVLLSVFAGQQDDGDWPQWFDYLDQHRAPGHRESHGDVVYWPLLALGEYLQMTGDLTLLDEPVGWVGSDALLPPTAMRDHVLAAVDHLLSERSADPRLPAYGHGDWNDSLQPARPELARQLVSTWTAGLEAKALGELADGVADSDQELAARLLAVAGATVEAVHDSLLVEGELCGYAIVTADGVEPLVHPRDRRTGLRHGSLQMIHAIADEQLSSEEAAAHVRIIDEHLDGPVGIYLFDNPVDYHGGETHTFLRAEAATFWGREIGLMYTHAHLRWIEALLRLGLAERAWRALDLVIPDGLSAAVPGARPRQSNCYFSSIDAEFRDRDDAESRAESMFDPSFGFEGGWRVYSSGPGLVLRLVTEGFLGLRLARDGVVVDPVLPVGELEAVVNLAGVRVRVSYDVTDPGHGVIAVESDGAVIDTEPAPRRYRPGGVRIPAARWRELAEGRDEVVLRVRVGG